jgi:hypothetical protein
MPNLGAALKRGPWWLPVVTAGVCGPLSWAIVKAGGPWLSPVALLASGVAGLGLGWLWARWNRE